MCKLSRQNLTGSLGCGKHYIAMHPCLRSNQHLTHLPVPFGRLRQRLAAAASEASCSGASPNKTTNGKLYANRVAFGSPAYHNPSEPSPGPGRDGCFIARTLQRLWQGLCNAAVVTIRLLMLAVAGCLASLIPRPASSLAAAQCCAATTSTLGRSSKSHTTGFCRSTTPERSAGTGLLEECAAAPTAEHSGRTPASPIADLAFSAAIAPAPAGASGQTTTTISRGVLRVFNRTYDTSQAPGDAAAASVSPTAAAAAAPGVASTNSVGGGGGATASGPVSSSSSNTATVVVAAGGVAVDPEDLALAQQLGVGVSEAGVVRLFERNRASVVNISGMRAMQTFTTLDLAKMPYGQGSGFIWGQKGHVITCYHLVKGAAEVKVTLYDNTSYTAKVLGYDAAKNLAVLKLSVPKSKLRELQPVTPGSAASLRVGQTVYGIGNPWGLGHTLSQGLVCGLGLELSAGLFPIKGVILIDGAPDPGSSGGALVDSKGSLVGMVVTPPASSGGGGGGGRSFAVPIDAVRGLITQILAYGRTVRPALGITMAPAQVLERVGLDGVLVLEVPPGSPAHAAGLRPTHRDIFGDLVLGDIMMGLDGKAVRSSSDVYDILDEHRVGDRIKLDVVRDGKQASLTVTLGERMLGAVEE